MCKLSDKARAAELIKRLAPHPKELQELAEIVWRNQNSESGDGSFSKGSWTSARTVLRFAEELARSATPQRGRAVKEESELPKGLDTPVMKGEENENAK